MKNILLYSVMCKYTDKILNEIVFTDPLKTSIALLQITITEKLKIQVIFDPYAAAWSYNSKNNFKRN